MSKRSDIPNLRVIPGGASSEEPPSDGSSSRQKADRGKRRPTTRSKDAAGADGKRSSGAKGNDGKKSSGDKNSGRKRPSGTKDSGDIKPSASKSHDASGEQHERHADASKAEHPSPGSRGSKPSSASKHGKPSATTQGSGSTEGGKAKNGGTRRKSSGHDAQNAHGGGRRRHHNRRKVLAILGASAITVLVVVWIVMAIVIPANRADDTELIQGEWLVDGTTTTCVINNKHFKLPGGTSYDYSLDTTHGTISVSVGDIDGGGTYRITTNHKGETRLSISEKDGSKVVTTRFTKLSDDINATPTSSYVTAESDSGSES